jgi:hypothetical protein
VRHTGMYSGRMIRANRSTIAESSATRSARRPVLRQNLIRFAWRRSDALLTGSRRSHGWGRAVSNRRPSL